MDVSRTINHTLERHMYSTPESPNVKHCDQCGETFTPSPSKKKNQRFCSAECRAAHTSGLRRKPEPRSKRCDQCGAKFDPHKLSHTRQRFCSDACRSAWTTEHGRVAIVCVCRHCGQEFQPKKRDRDQFCSRECSRAYFELHGHPQRRKPKAEPQPMPTCEICGQPCKRRGSKTCSPECNRERVNRKGREYWEAKAESKSPRPCKECGVVFVPEYGNKRRVFCSDECADTNAKRIQRKQKYNGNFNGAIRKRLRHMYGESWRSKYERINKRRVFERDKWRCQLCGCKVRRTKEWNTRQATIDHIVPIALGGEHSYANVQTACMECNSKKGATIQGQQRLFG